MVSAKHNLTTGISLHCMFTYLQYEEPYQEEQRIMLLSLLIMEMIVLINVKGLTPIF